MSARKPEKHLHTMLVCGLMLITTLPAWASPDCKRTDDAANSHGVRIPGDASGRQVIGRGRLAFHSAPDAICKIPGLFILPGETVNAYIEHAGYTSVLYLNARTGNEAIGWVESTRLRSTGQGIAPHQ